MKYLITNKLQNRKYPPGHHGREGFVRLWDYPSISILSPDLSSTVKWSSQIMIRSSQRFTSASSKVSRCAGCCLIKSCSSLMRAICAFLAAVSTQCHLDKDYTKNSVYRNMYPVLFSLDMQSAQPE